jgi:hypothetical protein
MPAFRTGKVVEIVEGDEDIIRLRVALGDQEINATGYPRMLGPVEVGDAVVVNTTGIELDLGTGGEGFVLWNLDGGEPPGLGDGHIVKLRYTPWQMEVMAAEAPESPHHVVLREASDLMDMPVVACGLHSQIAGVVAGIKAAQPRARVGYLMTDGAALPLAWSRLVTELRVADLLDISCTTGHAFGGELESVNVFSGLLALRAAGKADAVVVAMGPGVVGTGTALGFTAMEQGQVLDATTALGGRAIACLRINFEESRERHQGLSHHDIAALRVGAREPATLVLPELPAHQLEIVRQQIESAGLHQKHSVVSADGRAGLELLEERELRPQSMGRSVDEIPELFLAASAAGQVAAGMFSRS